MYRIEIKPIRAMPKLGEVRDGPASTLTFCVHVTQKDLVTCGFDYPEDSQDKLL